MNITATPYSTYPAGMTATPVPRSNPDGQAFRPVVNSGTQQTVTPPPESGQNKTADIPSQSEDSKAQPFSNTKRINGHDLTQAEIQLLDELETIDTEVRQHEMAHIAAGGQYITSGANFTYKRGPDGRNYAVGGEVSIDTSPVPGDPEATLRKMRQVKGAALAPANPSSQDIKVASKASQAVTKALSDLMILQAREQAGSNETQAFGDIKKAADSYTKVQGLPETEPSSFKIAV